MRGRLLKSCLLLGGGAHFLADEVFCQESGEPAPAARNSKNFTRSDTAAEHDTSITITNVSPRRLLMEAGWPHRTLFVEGNFSALLEHHDSEDGDDAEDHTGTRNGKTRSRHGPVSVTCQIGAPRLGSTHAHSVQQFPGTVFNKTHLECTGYPPVLAEGPGLLTVVKKTRAMSTIFDEEQNSVTKNHIKTPTFKRSYKNQNRSSPEMETQTDDDVQVIPVPLPLNRVTYVPLLDVALDRRPYISEKRGFLLLKPDPEYLPAAGTKRSSVNEVEQEPRAFLKVEAQLLSNIYASTSISGPTSAKKKWTWENVPISQDEIKLAFDLPDWNNLQEYGVELLPPLQDKQGKDSEVSEVPQVLTDMLIQVWLNPSTASTTRREKRVELSSNTSGENSIENTTPIVLTKRRRFHMVTPPPPPETNRSKRPLGVVQVDHARKGLLVDGTPWRGAGWYLRIQNQQEWWDHASSLERIKQLIEIDQIPKGINVGMLYSIHLFPYDEQLKFLDWCYERNFKIMYMPGRTGMNIKGGGPFDDPKALYWIRSNVTLVKHHPAVLGYYICDDCCTSASSDSKMAQMYEIIKRWDPYRATIGAPECGDSWLFADGAESFLPPGKLGPGQKPKLGTQPFLQLSLDVIMQENYSVDLRNHLGSGDWRTGYSRDGLFRHGVGFEPLWNCGSPDVDRFTAPHQMHTFAWLGALTADMYDHLVFDYEPRQALPLDRNAFNASADPRWNYGQDTFHFGMYATQLQTDMLSYFALPFGKAKQKPVVRELLVFQPQVEFWSGSSNSERTFSGSGRETQTSRGAPRIQLVNKGCEMNAPATINNGSCAVSETEGGGADPRRHFLRARAWMNCTAVYIVVASGDREHLNWFSVLMGTQESSGGGGGAGHEEETNPFWGLTGGQRIFPEPILPFNMTEEGRLSDYVLGGAVNMYQFPLPGTFNDWCWSDGAPNAVEPVLYYPVRERSSADAQEENKENLDGGAGMTSSDDVDRSSASEKTLFGDFWRTGALQTEDLESVGSSMLNAKMVYV